MIVFSGIFRHFKENFLFLLPFFIGIGIGAVLFGNVLSYLFANFEIPTKLLFIGLIIGSIPSLLKETHSKNNKRFRLHYLLYTFFAFLIGLLLLLLEDILPSHLNTVTQTFPFLIFCGFCMSIGIVFPGVSSSVILMCLGSYYIYLEAISSLNFTILLPMGIGAVLGSIVFLLCIRYLLKLYPIQTMYAIVGFVLGSTLILVPSMHIQQFYFLLIIPVGFYIATKLS